MEKPKLTAVRVSAATVKNSPTAVVNSAVAANNKQQHVIIESVIAFNFIDSLEKSTVIIK